MLISTLNCPQAMCNIIDIRQDDSVYGFILFHHVGSKTWLSSEIFWGNYDLPFIYGDSMVRSILGVKNEARIYLIRTFGTLQCAYVNVPAKSPRWKSCNDSMWDHL